MRREISRVAAKLTSSLHSHRPSWYGTRLPLHLMGRSYIPVSSMSSSSSSSPQPVEKIPNQSSEDPVTAVVEQIPITFVDKSGKEILVLATVGKNLLEIAHEHNIELEGACGGELACATCHLVFERHIYDSLPKKVPEEDDMLDLAFKLTDTSRLGCQIRVKSYMIGMKVQIPDDGY